MRKLPRQGDSSELEFLATLTLPHFPYGPRLKDRCL